MLSEQTSEEEKSHADGQQRRKKKPGRMVEPREKKKSSKLFNDKSLPECDHRYNSIIADPRTAVTGRIHYCCTFFFFLCPRFFRLVCHEITTVEKNKPTYTCQPYSNNNNTFYVYIIILYVCRETATTTSYNNGLSDFMERII